MFKKGRVIVLSLVFILTIGISIFAIKNINAKENEKLIDNIKQNIELREVEKSKLNTQLDKIKEKYKDIKTPASDPVYRQKMSDKKDELGKEYGEAIKNAGGDASKVNQEDYVLKEELTQEMQKYYAEIDIIVKKYDALEEKNIKDREEMSKLLPMYSE